MSTNKFLTILNGIRTLVTAIASSAGAGDANKIIATGSDGKLHPSFLPITEFVYFHGGIQTDSHGSIQLTLASDTFIKIPIATVFKNSHPSNFDSSNYTFEIPIKGLYSVLTRLRLTESTSQNPTPTGFSGGQKFISYGQGANTLNVDGSWFQWFVVVPAYTEISPRNGSLNIREAEFNVGDKLFMYAYFDNGVGKVVNSEVIIRLLRPN